MCKMLDKKGIMRIAVFDDPKNVQADTNSRVIANMDVIERAGLKGFSN